MESYYNCLSVKADNLLWLLQDKALEITGEAIEEVKDGFIIRTEKDIEPIKSQLIAYAQELETIMSESINVEFSEQTLKNQDWIANYRDSITPIECGKYYIHPSWFEDKNPKINIIIDPALAFGSGHHASTFGCLKALEIVEAEFQSLNNKKVLDVGCGSGILSICAKKSGANVWACDTDEVAVDSTKDNAVKNNVELEKIFLGSLNAIPEAKESFDIVMANILADIIVALPLQSFVKKGGYLILSGILDKYIPKVLDKFKNFKIVSQEIKQEWATLVLQK